MSNPWAEFNRHRAKTIETPEVVVLTTCGKIVQGAVLEVSEGWVYIQPKSAGMTPLWLNMDAIVTWSLQ